MSGAPVLSLENEEMMSTIIEFSAQFGGQDAATAALPHFKALKAASRELRLKGFPFPILSYILRVDGEVSRFQLSGAGYLKIDSRREYLSVDIGIEFDDRERIVDVISAAILSSVGLIKENKKVKRLEVDFSSLESCLSDLLVGYKKELTSQLSR